MRKIFASTKFKKELKLAIKRGCKISLLNEVIAMLVNEQTLPQNYHDHALKGDYSNNRECHITPDWLLIYELSEDKTILYLIRTGTHSDLF